MSIDPPDSTAHAGSAAHAVGTAPAVGTASAGGAAPGGDAAPADHAGPTVDASRVEPGAGEFLDLLYAVLHSVRRETAVLLRSVGTTPGQLRFLRTLSRCGQAQRLGEIAERLDVVPRSVTSKVDQAEADGHVRRIPDPTDRRATLIELTDAGRALLAAVAVQQHEGATERLAVLPPDERAELLRLLRRVAAGD